MFKVRQRVFVLTIFFIFLSFQMANAQLNFETATLGPTGQGGGWTLSSTQFLGAKFTVNEPVRVTSVGGHLVASSNQLFVAINPLSAGTDLPNDISLSDAIFSTAFNGPSSSDDMSITTDFCLPPGRYSIMFGSNLFGATGSGAMPGNNPEIGTPEYFFFDGTAFQDNGFSNARFFVNGLADSTCGLAPTAVPTITEWGTIIFMVLAGLGAAYYLRRQSGAKR